SACCSGTVSVIAVVTVHRRAAGKTQAVATMELFSAGDHREPRHQELNKYILIAYRNIKKRSKNSDQILINKSKEHNYITNTNNKLRKRSVSDIFVIRNSNIIGSDNNTNINNNITNTTIICTGHFLITIN
ncbi:hypothetical protein Ahia01_000756600, partial [Argonauta hians]